MKLKEWFANNEPSDEMLWKKALVDQVLFVRDRLEPLMCRTRDDRYNLVEVVGTHSSKSIQCPVYKFEFEKEGLRIYMRDNFYNWNVTVESDLPITCDFLGVFDDKNYNYCFCEGMESWKRGTYAESNKSFTACLYNNYDLYALFRVLRNFFGISFKAS